MIDGLIFMGAGERTKEQVEYLHKRLEEALSILGGIQQGPDPTDPNSACEQHDHEVAEGEKEIEQIAREIYLALTGKSPDKDEVRLKDSKFLKEASETVSKWRPDLQQMLGPAPRPVNHEEE